MGASGAGKEECLCWPIPTANYFSTLRISPLAISFTLVSCSSNSSTMKIEAPYSSETSLNFQRTVQRYNPEDTS
jgi:hypothetical protein